MNKRLLLMLLLTLSLGAKAYTTVDGFYGETWLDHVDEDGFGGGNWNGNEGDRPSGGFSPSR